MKWLGLKRTSICGIALLSASCGTEHTHGELDGAVVTGDGPASPDPGQSSGDGASPPRDGMGNDATSTCAEAKVKATRVPATVWLVIDNSFDMAQNTAQDLEPPWTKIRRILLGPSGVIAALQDNIRFGFTAPGDGSVNMPLMSCNRTLPVVEPALNNHDAIAARYPSEADLDAAPMPYYGMKAVLDHTLATPEEERGDIAVVLGRSPQGERICPTFLGTDYQAAVQEMDEVMAKLTALGVKVYVFRASVGAPTGDAVVLNRIAELARMGGTGRGPLPNNSAEELTMELKQLSTALISCDVRLNGDVTAGQECQGRVTVDGKQLECNAADGWRLKASNLIEITGSACAELKQKVAVDIQARFPCDVIVF